LTQAADPATSAIPKFVKMRRSRGTIDVLARNMPTVAQRSIKATTLGLHKVR